ncbi:MAG: hemerythrin domain-containing protein [Rhodospirillales bacterium]
MKLPDVLLGEHAAFRALFDEIEGMASFAGEVAQNESAMTVLATEVKSHAALEEKLLFSALEPHAETDELIAEMRAEHQQVRLGLERIEDARDLNEALEAVRQTLAIARRHLENEEKLYALAEEVLDDETLIQLGEAWATAHSVKRG